MNTQIYEEATEWIIQHRSDSLDVDAKRRFDTWLRESPQHVRAYLEMSTIWEDVPALHPEANPSATELIARTREDNNVVPLDGISAEALGLRPEHLPSPEPKLQSMPIITVPASQSLGRTLLAIAAMLIVTVGISGWLYLQRGVYSTDIGEQRLVRLDDGSTLELNARTKVKIRYTESQRSIELIEGQALFKVAKDPSRPFVVDSNGTLVRAVGTQFDVYRKDTGTTVTVLEGKVAVIPARPESSETDSAQRTSSTQDLGPSAQALVIAGEQLMVSAITLAKARVQAPPQLQIQLPAPKPADIEAATAWTQQRLVFDFTPLTEVAEEFNRYNRRPLKIDCEANQTSSPSGGGQEGAADPCAMKISGSFSSTDPTLLLRFLREQPEIIVIESANEIRISRRDAGAG